MIPGVAFQSQHSRPSVVRAVSSAHVTPFEAPDLTIVYGSVRSGDAGSFDVATSVAAGAVTETAVP